MAWLVALVCGLLLAPAWAERKEPAVPVIPPQPVQLSVKVRRDGKTEIPLSIHGKANEPLKFLIRTAPVQGKTAEPRATGRETAVVVYEPPADLAVTTDRFYYAVQSAAGVSASVEVLVTITDLPPQLTIMDTLEFAAVKTGDTSAKYLEISNSGGSLAVGEVIVDAPWRIEGKTGYRLGAGDVAIYKLIFAPSVGGSFEGFARFTSDNSRSTTLRGTAESSVTVTPADLVLRQVPGDPARTASLELANQTDQPRHLQFKGDVRLQLPSEVHLPPREKVSISVQTAAGDVRPLQTEFLIVAPDLELHVPVKAAAVGAILRTSPSAIAFGRVPVNRTSSARFEVQNIGGAPGEVVWSIGAPFRTRQTSTLLLPGEKRGIDLEIEGAKTGPYRAWLQCKSGAQSFEIPVEAQIVAPGTTLHNASPSAPAATGSPPAPDNPDPTAPDAPLDPPRKLFTPAVPTDWLGDRVLPQGVEMTAITPTTATLEWPVSLSPATSFRVDLRQFSFAQDHSLVVTWLTLEALAIQRKGANYVVTIKDLEPAQPWTVRVLPLKADGAPEARLFAIDFTTPRKASYLPTISPLRGMLAVLAIIVAWQAISWWRRRAAPL